MPFIHITQSMIFSPIKTPRAHIPKLQNAPFSGQKPLTKWCILAFWDLLFCEHMVSPRGVNGGDFTILFYQANQDFSAY